MSCTQHKFVYRDTARSEDIRGGGATKFTRTDFYFCENCLHVEGRTQSGYGEGRHGLHPPMWYTAT